MEEIEKDLGESPSSFWPILLAASLLLIAIGAIYTLIISAIGVLGLLVCIAGWTLENRHPAEEESHE